MIKNMKRKVLKKYKKDDKKSSLLTAMISFYFSLALFMILSSNIYLINISHKYVMGNVDYSQILDLKFNIICYVIIVLSMGIAMLIGSLTGIVGIIKGNLNLIWLSIIILIIATLLFVIMDGYYGVIYNVMSCLNYIINIFALVASSWLLIQGYKNQKILLK